MANLTQDVHAWYLRNRGKIQGPFPVDTLISMKQRGRIGPGAEVSSDRAAWIPISRLGSPFEEPSAPPSLPAALSTQLGDAAMEPQCHFSMDGSQQGPVPLSVLQGYARSRQLAPTDLVWIEGEPQWKPAYQVSGLIFAPATSHATSWIRANPAASACLGILILAVLLAPSWYVIAVSRERQRRIDQAAAAQKAAQEKEDSLRKEEREDRYRREKDEKDREAFLKGQAMQAEAQGAARKRDEDWKNSMLQEARNRAEAERETANASRDRVAAEQETARAVRENTDATRNAASANQRSLRDVVDSQKCRECGGTGYKFLEGKCPACNGRGR
jgi:hypothetical protein